MARPNNRMLQMKTQEEIILKKKQEILEKQRNAELVKQMSAVVKGGNLPR